MSASMWAFGAAVSSAILTAFVTLFRDRRHSPSSSQQIGTAYSGLVEDLSHDRDDLRQQLLELAKKVVDLELLVETQRIEHAAELADLHADNQKLRIEVAGLRAALRRYEQEDEK